MADPHRFAEWRSMLAMMPDQDSKLGAFTEACWDIMQQSVIAGRFDKGAAVDELTDQANVAGLIEAVGLPEIERIIGEAVRRVEKQKPKQKTNGQQPPDAIEPLPVVNAFPIDAKAMPRRPWLVPGLLMRRQVTLLVAPPGSGKSLLTLQIGMLCCSRIPEWSHWKPRASYRVLIINVEEDEDEMRRRLCAATVVMNVPQDELDGFYIAHAGSIVVAKADNRTKTVVATPMLDRIEKTINDLKIDIVVVDPFAETFAGDENSNSELKWAAVLWREVARKCNCSVMLVHHAKKYAQNMAGDMDAARGGGALSGVARIVATLFNMTEKESEAFEGKKGADGEPFDSEQRHRYIRFDDAKANLALINARARWFYKRSISLDNGGDGEPADEVGVLVPWDAPSAFDNMSNADASKILDLIDDGYLDDEGKRIAPMAPKRSGNTPRWAGYAVIQVMQCTEKDAQAIIKRWLKEKVLLMRDEVTATSKDKPVHCVYSNPAMRPGAVTSSDELNF